MEGALCADEWFAMIFLKKIKVGIQSSLYVNQVKIFSWLVIWLLHLNKFVLY